MKKHVFAGSVYREVFTFLLIVIIGSYFASAHAQLSADNPWSGGGKQLIDDNSRSAKKNSWTVKKHSDPSNEFDASKYPPLDENEALGAINAHVPSGNASLTPGYADMSSGSFHYPQTQDYDQVPVYPINPSANYQENVYGQAPQARWGQQSDQAGNQQGFQQGSQRGYPGLPKQYNSGGGFPFSSNSGGGFPFGMGNNWMPFSNKGLW